MRWNPAARVPTVRTPVCVGYAPRLCGEAQGGQILVSSKVAATVEGLIDAEEVGPLVLKGSLKPVPAFNILGLKASA